jgi:hypothetical protein
MMGMREVVATYCLLTVSPMDTRRGKETMDHKEAEDAVEGAEETEDSKQCNKEESNLNKRAILWEGQCKRSSCKWTVWGTVCSIALAYIPDTSFVSIYTNQRVTKNNDQ